VIWSSFSSHSDNPGFVYDRLSQPVAARFVAHHRQANSLSYAAMRH